MVYPVFSMCYFHILKILKLITVPRFTEVILRSVDESTINNNTQINFDLYTAESRRDIRGQTYPWRIVLLCKQTWTCESTRQMFFLANLYAISSKYHARNECVSP